jgi:WD40 repeat protein
MVSRAVVDVYAGDEVVYSVTLTDPDFVLSGDGRYLAQRTGERHVIRVWDLASGQALGDLAHDPAPPAVQSESFLANIYTQTFVMAFNDSYNLLVAGYGDHTLGVWDLATLTETRLDVAPLTKRIAFSPDGELMAASGADAIAVVTQLGVWRTSDLLALLWDPGGGYLGDRPFSPDGAELLTLYKSGYGRYALNAVESTFLGFSGTGLESAVVEFSQDGQYLIVRGDGVTQIRYAADNRLASVSPEDIEAQPGPASLDPDAWPAGQEHVGNLEGLALQGDTVVAWGHGPEGRLIIWPRNGERVFTLAQAGPQVGFTDALGVACDLALDQLVWIYWEGPADEVGFECGSPGLAAAAPAADRLAYSGGRPSEVLVLDLVDRAQRLLARTSDGAAVERLYLSLDGEVLLIVGDSPEIPGKTVSELALYLLQPGGQPRRIELASTGEVPSLDYSAAADLIVAANPFSFNGTAIYSRTDLPAEVYISDIAGKTRVYSLDGLNLLTLDITSRSVAFSPDGQLLAIGGVEGQIVLVDPDSSEVLATLSGAHSRLIVALQFSLDGHTLYALGDDGSISLWGVP